MQREKGAPGRGGRGIDGKERKIDMGIKDFRGFGTFLHFNGFCHKIKRMAEKIRVTEQIILVVMQLFDLPNCIAIT